MVRIFTILAGVLMVANIFAQFPEKMSYQAIIRNSNDNLVTNQLIGMQISILQGSSTGLSVYVETQTPTTNANGLVSIEVGSGISDNVFSDIDWANGPYFIKTETDLEGGTSYTISGTSQFLSVPYAFYAETAKNVVWSAEGDTISTNNWVGIGTNHVDNVLHIKTPANSSKGITLEGTSNNNSNSGIRYFDESTRIASMGVSLGSGSYYSSDASTRDFVIRSEDYNLIFATSSYNNYKASLYIANNGSVGVNTAEPQRSLHVKDVLRLEPRVAPPPNPEKGDMYMDDITNKLLVYDGTTWQACW